MSPKKDSKYYGGHQRRAFNSQREEVVICPYCGLPATFRDGSIIYGLRYKDVNIYICSQYPLCDAFISCHKGTKTPMGTMANGDTRYWRKRAHETLDPLWKSGIMKRQSAYKKIAQRLGVDTAHAHIGMFDIEQCKIAIKVAQELRQLHQQKQNIELS